MKLLRLLRCLNSARLLLRNLTDILLLLLVNYEMSTLSIHHDLLLRCQVMVTAVGDPFQHHLLLLSTDLLLPNSCKWCQSHLSQLSIRQSDHLAQTALNGLHLRKIRSDLNVRRLHSSLARGVSHKDWVCWVTNTWVTDIPQPVRRDRVGQTAGMSC